MNQTAVCEIRGAWIVLDGVVQGDANCEKIQRLIADELVYVSSDASGWLSLYRDPRDESYWELDYPDADTQGGGPPVLRRVTAEDASERYPSVTAR